MYGNSDVISVYPVMGLSCSLAAPNNNNNDNVIMKF